MMKSLILAAALVSTGVMANEPHGVCAPKTPGYGNLCEMGKAIATVQSLRLPIVSDMVTLTSVTSDRNVIIHNITNNNVTELDDIVDMLLIAEKRKLTSQVEWDAHICGVPWQKKHINEGGVFTTNIWFVNGVLMSSFVTDEC